MLSVVARTIGAVLYASKGDAAQAFVLKAALGTRMVKDPVGVDDAVLPIHRCVSEPWLG